MRDKPAVDRETQMWRDTLVQNESTKCSVQDWRDEVGISKLYSAYCDECMNMSAAFQSMRDGHLGRISVVKHRVELLDDNTQTGLSKPYCAGPKLRIFENVEIEKILKDNTIESVQTKEAALLVFATKKNGFYAFALMTSDATR